MCKKGCHVVEIPKSDLPFENRVAIHRNAVNDRVISLGLPVDSEPYSLDSFGYFD